MVGRWILALCAVLAVAGCKFDRGDFDDRGCTIDTDCNRPDQACVQNTCAQKACTTASDCGSDFAYACTDVGCVVEECNGPNDCSTGYACTEQLCTGFFNVTSATSVSNASIELTFDGAPDPTTATTLSNYAVSGLTLSGTPIVVGNTVTLATSPQTAIGYTVTASGVLRAGDQVALTTATAAFAGRTAFGVFDAASTSSIVMTVTFDAPPDGVTAMTLSNYNVPGLTLSGTPLLFGNTVTLATSPQAQISYTVTVSNVRRAADAEGLTGKTATFGGRTGFNVTGAAAISSTSVEVTFDAPPNPGQATVLANYGIAGLTLSGVPVLAGNKVTIATSPQDGSSFAVTVANVTRAADGESLAVLSANFVGKVPFNVATAIALNSNTIQVTFDAAPDPVDAIDPASYAIVGLTIGGTPLLSGNIVTLTTSPQSQTSYTVVVSGVARASDNEPLLGDDASFGGRAPFDVAGAVSATSSRIIVTFDAAPDATKATTLSNYSVSGLTLSGTPILAGNSVTITTSPQSDTPFSVVVTGVTRANDNEPLTTTSAGFTGRSPFNVINATSKSSTSVVVTFDAAPDAGQATILGNYSIPGLTLIGAPVVGANNKVTLTTTPQSDTTFAVLVSSNVTRQSDAEALTVSSDSFAGRPPFNVASASSASNVSMTVTFDAPPDPAAAVIAANYNVPGLTLSAPQLSGNSVTLTTTAQSVSTFTVTVSNIRRESDNEPLADNNANFLGRTGFNVASAASVNSTSMSVTFDSTPVAGQATTLSNYNVPGLTLSGTPVLAGNTVTITTSLQTAQSFTVTVSNVTRQSDGSPLAVNSASFTHVSFNVTSGASLATRTMSVTFDAPPNASSATTLANYNVPGLTLSGTPVLAGNTVTITTSTQSAATFTVTVNNVTRASDGTVLTVKAASFTGRAPFNVASAASLGSGTMRVTFSDPPTAAQATTLANYNVPGLALSGTPLLSGNVVTLTTAAQAGITYTVTVSNVTRASDSEALSTTNASFTGTALATPTVTTVVVQSTSPNNGTRFYNTGTATVTITGTEFTGVSCPNGVALDDLNGDGTVAVNTKPTSCTVDSGTQITATFPAGIRTNGALGWNVKVTNAIGTNATSTIKVVPFAGLLISEVFVDNSGGNSDEEFIELYNPTDNPIEIDTIGTGSLQLSLHIRSATGTDTLMPLTFIANCTVGLNCQIKSHGYFLIVSTATDSGDSWFAARDATYNASSVELESNGGVYISLSSTSQSKVIDKLGWGTQGVAGREGTAIGNITTARSSQRKPAGGAGAATDTDVNSTDFLAPSTTITPKGSSAAPEP